MTFADFKTSLNKELPPTGLSRLLQALWQEAKGNWEAAHRIAQAEDSVLSNWIHAYLHRKEGDWANASYWYAHAGKTMPRLTLAEEWEHLVQTLLETNKNG